MNDTYFACKKCQVIIDSGYRWCYWALEHKGIVEGGKPVNLEALNNASEYWAAEHEGGELEVLLPKIRRFLADHQGHEITYGDFEELKLPLSDDGSFFPGWWEIST